jgi:sugar phosphate isomerase/epimerase
LGNLHDIGWRNLETVGGNMGLGDAGLKAVLDKYQLQVVGAHEGMDEARWESVLDRSKLLGQHFVGASTFGPPGLDTLDHVLATAANLDKLGQAAHARGLKFYVHSHSTELKQRFEYDLKGNGHPRMLTAWEIVAARTDPRYVSFEVDIHWARVGMGLDHFDDLLEFLKAHRSRIVLLHIKDTTADGKIADLGLGTTDWRRVVAAAGSQVQYYLWEFDGPPKPLDSARIAFAYMTCGMR